MAVRAERLLGELKAGLGQDWRLITKGQDHICEVVIGVLSLGLLYALIVVSRTCTLFEPIARDDNAGTEPAALLFSGHILLICIYLSRHSSPDLVS